MTNTAPQVNRYGFPIETCSRCGGTGRYSWCQMYGDVCFKCSGSGYQIVKRAATAWDAYCAACRQARETLVGRLEVGDRVKEGGSLTGTVVLVQTHTDRPCAWTTTRTADGGEVRTPWAYWATVTMTDERGSVWTVKTMTNIMVKRVGKRVDRASFLAMIPKARARKVAA